MYGRHWNSGSGTAAICFVVISGLWTGQRCNEPSKDYCDIRTNVATVTQRIEPDAGPGSEDRIQQERF